MDISIRYYAMRSAALRGLGETEQAEADLSRARELGYQGD